MNALGKMKHFPIVVADNFYEDPLKIRDYALQLEYTKSETGDYPANEHYR